MVFKYLAADGCRLLVVLDLALLEALVHSGLDLLAERVHLVGLLLDQRRLGGHDLLVPLLHVSFALLFLHLLRLDLNLMRLCVLLLARKLLLDLFQVQKLRTLLESQGQLLLEHLPVLLKIPDVAVLERANCLLVLLLDLCKRLVPALVEVLVLHEVRLLDFLALASLLVNELLPSACEVLDLELLDAVLRHLGLHILAFHLTLLSVLFKDQAKR